MDSRLSNSVLQHRPVHLDTCSPACHGIKTSSAADKSIVAVVGMASFLTDSARRDRNLRLASHAIFTIQGTN